MEQQIGVIIVAGGGGTRMGGSRPKQFTMLGGLPVLAHTINNFAGALPGAEIVVVLPAAHADFWKDFAARFDIAAHTVTTGGDERFHSVKNGLKALKRDPELIAVQDGVRPLASHGMIRRAVAAAAEHGTAIPVVEAVDSYRETDGTASRIADRRRLRIVQTRRYSAPTYCAAPTRQSTAQNLRTTHRSWNRPARPYSCAKASVRT